MSARITSLALGVITLLFATACTSAQTGNGGWPTKGWEATSSDSLAQDLAPLEAELADKNLSLESLIIVADDTVMEEHYFEDITDGPTALFSATKSINSLLVGIAIEQGFIESEQVRIADFFPDRTWDNPSPLKDELTIEDVLTMSCGFEWNETAYAYDDPRNPYHAWETSPDRVQFVLDLPMREAPGESFNYNTAASHLIPAIIHEATGQSALEFATRYLFEPLGIDEDNVIWSTDSQGINKGGGLNMRPQDMARLGYLVLHKGEWGGIQIVPADWIEKSLNPAFGLSFGRSFGYHWYLYDGDEVDIVAAEGFKGQSIFVIPEKDAVVVMTANLDGDSARTSMRLLKEFIIPQL